MTPDIGLEPSAFNSAPVIAISGGKVTAPEDDKVRVLRVICSQAWKKYETRGEEKEALAEAIAELIQDAWEEGYEQGRGY